jgi:hypothetical protein
MGPTGLLSEAGMRNFFLSPQSQFRNLKEAKWNNKEQLG